MAAATRPGPHQKLKVSISKNVFGWSKRTGADGVLLRPLFIKTSRGTGATLWKGACLFFVVLMDGSNHRFDFTLEQLADVFGK